MNFVTTPSPHTQSWNLVSKKKHAEKEETYLLCYGSDEALVVRDENYAPIPCFERMHQCIQTLEGLLLQKQYTIDETKEFTSISK